MTLPWPLLWLIDPAGAYWARRTPRLDGPTYRGGAVVGPGVPGGNRQATAEELVAMRLDARDDHDRYERDLDATARRWAPELRQAADQLLSDGSTRLRLGGTDVDARIIRFWRGDSLLDVRYRLPDGEGESRTRIPRRPQSDLLVDYLVQAATYG